MTFRKPESDTRKEIVSFIEHELCRLDVLLDAGRFKDCPDMYQDIFCAWNEQLNLYKEE